MRCHPVFHIAELSCARSSGSGAPWLIKFSYLCIQEIWVSGLWQNRLSASPPPLYDSGCETPHLLVGSPRRMQSVFNLILDINTLYGQLTAVKVGYPLTSISWLYRGFRSTTQWVTCFPKLSADQLLVLIYGRLRSILTGSLFTGYLFMTKLKYLYFRKTFLKTSHESFAPGLG